MWCLCDTIADAGHRWPNDPFHWYVLYVIWRRKKNEWVQLWDNARAGVQAIMQVHSVHTAEPSRQTRV